MEYADDNALVTHTEEALQTAVNAFIYVYDALGLTLDARKTQFLSQPSPDHTHERKKPKITVGDQCLSSVETFYISW